MSTHRKAYLEITNKCNLSCAFCPGNDRKPKMLSEEEFTLLAGKLRNFAEYLYFHLMGEPTSHPLLPNFLHIAKKMGFKPIITTNGTLLPRREEELLREEARPYKVNISLHAFEANPPGMSFEDYISGCLAFSKKAAEAGIITVLRLWNLDGRAEGALHQRNEQILSSMHDFFDSEWTKVRTGEKLCDKVFLEWGEKFDWPRTDGDILSEKGFCYGLRDQIGVLSDGTVVPCCLDRNGDLALGNLFDAPLDEILSSKRAKDIYNGFTSHICTEEMCKRCMRASYYR